MRTLITGGAGFIGSALAERLLAEGHDVVILDDFSSGKHERVDHFGAPVVDADIRDRGAVMTAARGCDSVLHFAYIQGTKNFYRMPSEILSVAIEGMTSVLSACRATGIRELMLVSSAEAHQSEVIPTPEDTPLTVPDVFNPRFSYGGGKIACELIASAAHFDKHLDRLMIVRPHNVIGPDMSADHIVPDLAKRMNTLIRDYAPNITIPLRIQGDGSETRSYTYIDDAVDQFMLVLNRAGSHGAYHVGSRDERTTAEVAREIAKCYDREIALVRTPLRWGSPLRRQPAMDFLDGLSYTPKTAFPEAIAKTVEWYQGHAE